MKKDTEQMIYTRAFQNIRLRLAESLEAMDHGQIDVGKKMVREVYIYTKQYERIARDYED